MTHTYHQLETAPSVFAGLGNYHEDNGNRFDGFGDLELVAEFHGSKEFRRLSPREQMLSQYAVKCVAEGMPWRVMDSPIAEGALVQIPEPLHLVTPDEIQDTAVLSGAAGWHELHYSGKRKQFLRSFGEITLDHYVAIGALSVMARTSWLDEFSWSAYTVDNDDTTRRKVGIGGSHHGDFVAKSMTFATRCSVVDPTGRRQYFAPSIDEQTVAAYHSVESELAVAMMEHLVHQNPEAIEAIRSNLLSRIASMPMQRGPGNFADYGGSELRASRYLVVPPVDPAVQRTLESFIVYPGNHAISMDVISRLGGVELCNVDSNRPDVALGKIFVPDEEIPEFIATMTAANGGRTSPEQIIDAIQGVYIYQGGKRQ